MNYVAKLYVNDTENSTLVLADPTNWGTTVTNNTSATIAVMDKYHTYFVVPNDAYNYNTYNADKGSHSPQQISVLLPRKATLLVTMDADQVMENIEANRLANIDLNNTEVYTCSNSSYGTTGDIACDSMAVSNTANPIATIQVKVQDTANNTIYNNCRQSIKVADYKSNVSYIKAGSNAKFEPNATLFLYTDCQMITGLDTIVQNNDPFLRPKLPTIELSSDVVLDDRNTKNYPPSHDLSNTNLAGDYN